MSLNLNFNLPIDEEWVEEWVESYSYYIPIFIDYAKNRIGIRDWEKDDREEFLKQRNCVSSLRAGNFSKKQKEIIINNWDNNFIEPLYTIVNSRDYLPEENNNLYNKILKLTSKNGQRHKKAATVRFIAAFQPINLSTVIASKYLWEIYNILLTYGLQEIQECNTDLDLSHHIQKFINEQYPNDNNLARPTYAWQIKEFIDNQGNNQEEMKSYKKQKNIIFTGAPGTGKTYLAKQIAEAMGCSANETGFVQFHPSYDYTDFVEGLRPVQDKNGNIVFERKDGIFKKFCKEALKNPEKDYVFIIDEINRGEISKIFGELFFSIDPDYRGEKGQVHTQYQNLITDTDDDFYNGFYVPENVYIIGTMNDIDRSVESMDFALRRRFTFHEISAEDTGEEIINAAKLDEDVKEDAIERFNSLNSVIYDTEEGTGIDGLSPAYHIGGAYFKKLENYEDEEYDDKFEALWTNHLEPLLREYLRGGSDIEDKIDELYKAYNMEDDEEDEDDE